MLRMLIWRADRICRARDEGEGNETGKRGNKEMWKQTWRSQAKETKPRRKRKVG
jgi:hypothetical protein